MASKVAIEAVQAIVNGRYDEAAEALDRLTKPDCTTATTAAKLAAKLDRVTWERDAAYAELEETRAILRKYGSHLRECPGGMFLHGPSYKERVWVCTCGWDTEKSLLPAKRA